MDPSQLFGTIVTVYLSILAGFAALAATQAIEDDDRPSMGTRVYRSLNRTTLFLGLPAVLVGLGFLASQGSGSGQGSGIMSRDMGLCILLVIALGGLLVLWLGTLLGAFLGVAIARNLPATAAGLVVFTFASGGSPVLLVMLIVQRAVTQR